MNEEINELTGDEAKAWREAKAKAQEGLYRDDDHRAAAAAWLAHEWHFKSEPLRHNSPLHEWVERGLKIGVSDAELLDNADVRLEQMTRVLDASHVGAYSRYVKAHRPKKRKRTPATGRVGTVMAAVRELFVDLGRIPTKKAVSRATGIPQAQLSRNPSLAAAFDAAVAEIEAEIDANE